MELTSDTITQVSDKALAELCRQNRIQFSQAHREYQKRTTGEYAVEQVKEMNRLNNEYDIILREIGRRWMDQQGV